MTLWWAAQADTSPAGSASGSLLRGHDENAPIVILDEATSYTDPENEAVLQDAIGRLTRGKTLIVIAHRLIPSPMQTKLPWWSREKSWTRERMTNC